MADSSDSRRPRLAFPFTVLTQADTVRLVAGEDYRYTLTGAGLERWLPEFVVRLTGATPLATLLADLPQEQRASALQIVQRLYGERVLVDGPASAAHAARTYHCRVVGQGALCERLRPALPKSEGKTRLTILCQDRLDYGEALTGQREARAAGESFLWASCGALTRGYVGPLLLPDAGPCLSCLLRTFQRLSPAPEIYDALLDHGRQQMPFTSVTFLEEGLAILQALVQWKLGQAEVEQPSPALYRLHVLERDSLETSAHRVFIDPECPECHGGRR